MKLTQANSEQHLRYNVANQFRTAKQAEVEQRQTTQLGNTLIPDVTEVQVVTQHAKIAKLHDRGWKFFNSKKKVRLDECDIVIFRNDSFCALRTS